MSDAAAKPIPPGSQVGPGRSRTYRPGGRVAVDGAETFLGRAIVTALVERGVPVRALTLPPGRGVDGSSRIHPRAERAVAPLGDEDAIGRALEGTRAVVAARRLLEESRNGTLTFRLVHAERTQRLLKPAERAGLDRFLYIGMAGVERRGSGPLVKAERLAEAYLAAAKLPTLTLAPSLVVGPGDGHVSRMAAKAGRPWPVLVFVGQGWARSAPMAARDFGECAAKALLADEFETGSLTVGGPELMTAMDIQDRLLARSGRWKLKLHVPESIARLGAATVEKLSRRPPVTRARLSWLLEDMIPDRVTSTRLLGRRPRRFETAFGGERRASGTP